MQTDSIAHLHGSLDAVIVLTFLDSRGKLHSTVIIVIFSCVREEL